MAFGFDGTDILTKLRYNTKAMLSILTTLLAAAAIDVYNPVYPLVVDQDRNVLTEITVPADAPSVLNGEVTVSLSGVPLKAINDVSLVYTGTVSSILTRNTSNEVRIQNSSWTGGKFLWRDPNYTMEVASVKPKKSAMADGTLTVTLPVVNKQIVKGNNYFYVSLSVKGSKIDLADTFSSKVESIVFDGKPVEFKNAGKTDGRRYCVTLRTHGSDGADSYRIPGLVTTKSGALMAVYDIRWNTSHDLQAHIDVGFQKSYDGGRTWSKMGTAIDMGEWGGLPENQNGVGDPCILVDDVTGDIFVFGLWSHGLGGASSIFSSAPKGMDPIDVSQMVMVRSSDEGKTWSEPVNLTPMVKDPEISVIFQGPGRGITMADGTLVVPVQIWDPEHIPSGLIMYSMDHGDTWKLSKVATDYVCEDQVVEIEPGKLLLNMRNYANKSYFRKSYVTSDLGETWEPHVSDGILPEPICQASIWLCKADENVHGKDLLLFSNPDSQKNRVHFTVRLSEDLGATWPHAIELDEEAGWGYSCITMIDDDTLGIVYEGSRAQLTFQAIKLSDLLAN